VNRIFKEFRDFAMRGNLVELAIAFVMGVAFASLVTSFIETMINPVLGAIFGQPSFSSLTIDLWSNATLRYGAFLTAIINFAAIAATVFFFIVKPYNIWQAKRQVEEEAPPPPPEDDETLVVLRQIRDALAGD